MVKITYEDKINYLENRLEPMKKLLKFWSKLDEKHPTKKEMVEAIKKDIDIIECIIEDVRDFKMEVWLKSVLEVYDDKRLTQGNLRLRIKENISDQQGAIKCIKVWLDE